MFDIDYLRDMYVYNQYTGSLVYKKSAGCRKVGDSVGWMDGCYLKTKVNRKKIAVHRLIWLIVFGELPEVIDHINGDTTDNRLTNLRNVDARENSRNTKINKLNKSGLMGVSWYHGKKWVAYIGKAPRTSLGYSTDFFEACCLRKSAEAKMLYHINHGKR